MEINLEPAAKGRLKKRDRTNKTLQPQESPLILTPRTAQTVKLALKAPTFSSWRVIQALEYIS